MICTIVLSRILPERNVTLMFFRERKYAAEPTAKQGGLCAAQSPPWTLWILDLFKLKREDRIGKVTNFRATIHRRPLLVHCTSSGNTDFTSGPSWQSCKSQLN